MRRARGCARGSSVARRTQKPSELVLRVPRRVTSTLGMGLANFTRVLERFEARLQLDIARMAAVADPPDACRPVALLITGPVLRHRAPRLGLAPLARLDRGTAQRHLLSALGFAGRSDIERRHGVGGCERDARAAERDADARDAEKNSRWRFQAVTLALLPIAADFPPFSLRWEGRASRLPSPILNPFSAANSARRLPTDCR
jgi:hypothetical protein